MEYPCIKCKQQVRPRQHAISCDSCGQWQHRKCDTGIPVHVYQSAVRQAIEIVFKCEPCSMKSEPLPSLEDLLDQLGNIGKDSSDSEDGDCFNRDINSVRDNKVNDYSDDSDDSSDDDDDDNYYFTGQMKLNVSSFINDDQWNYNSSDSCDGSSSKFLLANDMNKSVHHNILNDSSSDDDDNDNNKPLHANDMNKSVHHNILNDSSSDSSDSGNDDNNDENNKPLLANDLKKSIHHNILNDRSSDSSDSDDDDDNGDNNKTVLSNKVKKPIKQLKVKFPISDSSDSEEDLPYWKLPSPDSSPVYKYEVIQGGSNVGTDILIDENCFTYTKKSGKNGTWYCTVRSKNRTCNAYIKEINGEYEKRFFCHTHHLEDHTRHIRIKVLKQAKEIAKVDTVKSGREIIKEAHAMVNERRFHWMLKRKHVDNMVNTLNRFRKSNKLNK
ncbi:hypothetical protein ACF0H5_006166 [Mactra antiquata]